MSLKEKMDPISIYNVEFLAICYSIIHFEASINTEKIRITLNKTLNSHNQMIMIPFSCD